MILPTEYRGFLASLWLQLRVKIFCGFILTLGALSVGEASHATVSPTLHYMMGIAFGHNIYSLLYHFINADWNDRFSQFLTNRQTWQGFARLFVYTSALVCHLNRYW